MSLFKLPYFYVFFTFTLLIPQAFAVEVGKDAAMKYFTGKPSRSPDTSSNISVSPPPSADYDSLLSVALGGLIQTQSYGWSEQSVEGWNVEAAYQTQSDYFLTGYALDFQKFVNEGEELSKIAFLFSMSFPRRQTFPVYIGVSAGPGFFFKQKKDESQFSFDYKAYMGMRLSQSYSLFFLEGGVKNHLHILTDGQFIGWYMSSGVAYRF